MPQDIVFVPVGITFHQHLNPFINAAPEEAVSARKAVDHWTLSTTVGASTMITPPTTTATQPTSTATSTSNSKGLSTGAKAGIGVGAGIGALAILCSAAFLRYRHRKAATPRSSPPDNVQREDHPHKEFKSELSADARQMSELGGNSMAEMPSCASPLIQLEPVELEAPRQLSQRAKG
ncbi:hypothetical protein F5Y18DRAFT_431947 [Xylariaceae sp. FL1019]|nr:hypothetical protein F5Y18DRAFT_431947 [Xylariaceae sp. FL1019]